MANSLSDNCTMRSSRLIWYRATLVCSLVVALASPLAGCRPRAGVPITQASTTRDHVGDAALPGHVWPLAYTLDLTVIPASSRFSGRVQIAISLAHATQRIVLHGDGLTVKDAAVHINGQRIPARAQSLEHGHLAIDVARLVPAGNALLEILYDAPFGLQRAGLYTVDASGSRYALTRFQPLAARRAFPCFDEPGFKAPFDISLRVPERHVAIGNEPELSVERLPSGLKRVRFARTPPLPTYLVAFVVGPFDVIEGQPIPANEVRTRAVRLRGVTVRGKGEQLGYALEHTAPVLHALERQLGMPYPFSKIDLVAAPGFGAAMESPGAILFDEWYLLVNPAKALEIQRRVFADVTAHELAHQWFGNLVTTRSWQDTWLNEGFATWLAHRAVQRVFPHYHADVEFSANTQHAMRLDQLSSVRAVREPISSAHDIANAFDSITYDKGAALLAMLERYLGEQTFRRGLHGYLNANRFGVASSPNFTAALSNVSDKPVAPILESFLSQRGVPAITVESRCTGTGAELTLRQRRYVPMGSSVSSAQTWHVPVCLRYRVNRVDFEHCTVLSNPEQRLTLTAGCPDWVFPNAGGAGYYYFALEADASRALLEQGYGALTGPERLALFGSLSAGFDAGPTSAAALLGAAPLFSAEPHALLVAEHMRVLRLMDEYLVSPAQRPAFQQHVAALYDERLRLLGWEPTPNEGGERRLLRVLLLSFVADVARSRNVRAWLAQQGRAYLGNDGGPLHPDRVHAELRLLALRIALEDGDQGLFQRTAARLHRLSDSDQRGELLAALGSVRDARSVRALRLSLDPRLNPLAMALLLRSQLGHRSTRAAALSFVGHNWRRMRERLSNEQLSTWPAMFDGFCSDARANRVRELFAPYVEQMPGGPRELAQTLERIRLCAARVQAQRASMQTYFAERPTH